MVAEELSDFKSVEEDYKEINAKLQRYCQLQVELEREAKQLSTLLKRHTDKVTNSHQHTSISNYVDVLSNLATTISLLNYVSPSQRIASVIQKTYEVYIHPLLSNRRAVETSKLEYDRWTNKGKSNEWCD